MENENMIKCFISHSSKDSSIALLLARHLSEWSPQISTFCSSVPGSIPIGVDYIQFINEQIDTCDYFIALLSDHYMSSKYCLIELGYAYARCVSLGKRNVIRPFALPGYSKGLDGTPLHSYEYYMLADLNQLGSFVNELRSQGGIIDNNKVRAFINTLKGLTIQNGDILSHADVIACCSDVMHPEATRCSLQNNEITLSFSFERIGIEPEFISAVIKFYNPFDLYDLYRSKQDLCLKFTLCNYTNSIHQMKVELQTETNQVIGTPYIIHVDKDNIEQETCISISAYSNYSNALSKVKNICFVINREYFDENEGTVVIKDINLE